MTASSLIEVPETKSERLFLTYQSIIFITKVWTRTSLSNPQRTAREILAIKNCQNFVWNYQTYSLTYLSQEILRVYFADYIISTSHNKVISLKCLTKAARNSILILTLELRTDWCQTCRTHPRWLSSKAECQSGMYTICCNF